MLIATATVVTLSPLHTLTLALLVFFVGVALTRALPLLQHYGIPEAVSGGIGAALVTWVCFIGFNIHISFDLAIRDQLFLIFFATIGLNARLADAWLGGRKFLTLLLLTVTFILAQNGLALLGTRIFDLPRQVGVLLGSAALIGGHGSAIAWSTVVEAQSGFAAADELALVTATLGLIAGGVLGSPIATLLIRHYALADTSPASLSQPLTQPSAHILNQPSPSKDSTNSVGEPVPDPDPPSTEDSSVLVADPLAPATLQPAPIPLSSFRLPESDGSEIPADQSDRPTLVNHMTVMYAMLVTLVAVVIGQWLHGVIMATGFTLPTFIPCLMVAMVMTNTIPLIFPTLPWPAKTQALGLITDYSLSIFLALSLMGMQLWSVLSLGGPFLVIFLVQMVMAIAFIFLIIFPSMGADYDAAVLSAGFAGYSLGATPTALANMTTITQKYRPAPQPFIILPLVSAVFVDVLNSVIIRFFVM